MYEIYTQINPNNDLGMRGSMNSLFNDILMYLSILNVETIYKCVSLDGYFVWNVKNINNKLLHQNSSTIIYLLFKNHI